MNAVLHCFCLFFEADSPNHFLRVLFSAEADIVGGGKQWAGLVYIGGTHPAAAGGAYMVLLYGFLGLRFEDGKPTLHPRLPEGWKKVQLQVHWQGKDWLLTAEEGQQA